MRNIRATVHPRVCGERFENEIEVIGEDGSSPRVRGTRMPLPPILLESRFIPACAGNAAPWKLRMFMKADGVFTKADTAERYDGRGV